jgi:hypothetical protein
MKWCLYHVKQKGESHKKQDFPNRHSTYDTFFVRSSLLLVPPRSPLHSYCNSYCSCNLSVLKRRAPPSSIVLYRTINSCMSLLFIRSSMTGLDGIQFKQSSWGTRKGGTWRREWGDQGGAGLVGWLAGWFIQASQLSRDQGAWEDRRAEYDSSKEVPT